MLTIAKIIIFLCWVASLCLVILLIKNENTNRKRMIIIEAIKEYCTFRIKNDTWDRTDLSLYDCMEPYDRTLWRLTDWSYKRILPRDKFEIIKPFIKE